MKPRITILLTACIHPKGMWGTALQDSNIRQKQYIQALTFYLEHTCFPVIFVENTATDLSTMFSSYIQKQRLEYITFNGNDFPKELGKGYGEAEILEYALQHSLLLKESIYLIKITGRLIINNINEISNSILLRYSRKCVRFDFCSENSIYTMCFICPIKWLDNGLKKYKDQINDSKGVYIEYILYSNLIASKNIILIPFIRPPQIDGISGSTNKKYSIKTTLTNICDNLYYLHLLIKKRGNTVDLFISKLIFFIYIVMLLIKKGNRKFSLNVLY